MKERTDAAKVANYVSGCGCHLVDHRGDKALPNSMKFVEVVEPAAVVLVMISS